MREASSPQHEERVSVRFDGRVKRSAQIGLAFSERKGLPPPSLTALCNDAARSGLKLQPVLVHEHLRTNGHCRLVGSCAEPRQEKSVIIVDTLEPSAAPQLGRVCCDAQELIGENDGKVVRLGHDEPTLPCYYDRVPINQLSGTKTSTGFVDMHAIVCARAFTCGR